MTRTRHARFGVVLALMLGGCGGLPRAAVPEPEPARPSSVRQGQTVRGWTERWALRDSSMAGSVLEVESFPPSRVLSEVTVARRGHLLLRHGGEILVRFAFDRVVTEGAMGTLYETYRSRSEDYEATIARETASGEAYELRLAAGTHGDIVAGLAPVGQVGR